MRSTVETVLSPELVMSPDFEFLTSLGTSILFLVDMQLEEEISMIWCGNSWRLWQVKQEMLTPPRHLHEHLFSK